VVTPAIRIARMFQQGGSGGGSSFRAMPGARKPLYGARK